MDGQVCYQADMAMDKIRDKVDKRMIATEGFVMILDYNENRMVELGDDLGSEDNSTPLQKRKIKKEIMLYVETVGKGRRH